MVNRTRDLSLASIRPLQAEGVARILDLRRVLDALPAAERAALFRDETHLGAAGHERIARALCEQLGDSRASGRLTAAD